MTLTWGATGCAGSARCLALALSLLVVLLSIVAPLVGAQRSSVTARPIAADHPTYLRHGLRWLDTNKRQFGATMNISMPATIAGSPWALEIEFEQADVQIAQYWGNWQADLSTTKPYRILPLEIVPDDSGVYYFSYNGRYDSETAETLNLSSIAVRAATLIPGPNAGSRVDLASLPQGMTSAPPGPQLPTAPFGAFLNPAPESGSHQTIPGKNANEVAGSSASADSDQKHGLQAPTIGIYVIIALISLFVVIIGVATVLRQRMRAHFRKQVAMAERPGENGFGAGDNALSRTEEGNSDAADLATVQSARPTKAQLLTIPTNPNRMSRFINGTTSDASDAFTSQTARDGERSPYGLMPAPPAAAAVSDSAGDAGMLSPYAPHKVIEEYAGMRASYTPPSTQSGRIQQMPTSDNESLDDDHSLALSDRMTMSGDAFRGQHSSSRRYLTDHSNYPMPKP